MPISIDEYRVPKFIKIKDRYPLSYDKKDRFWKFDTDLRSYRTGGFLQAGYNPNHNSTKVERIPMTNDDINLKPR